MRDFIGAYPLDRELGHIFSTVLPSFATYLAVLDFRAIADILGFLGSLPGFLTALTTIVTGAATVVLKRTSNLVTTAQKAETLETSQHKKNIELHEETEKAQANNIVALNSEIEMLRRECRDKRRQIVALHSRVEQLEDICIDRKITIPNFPKETDDA